MLAYSSTLTVRLIAKSATNNPGCSRSLGRSLGLRWTETPCFETGIEPSLGNAGDAWKNTLSAIIEGQCTAKVVRRCGQLQSYEAVESANRQ